MATRVSPDGAVLDPLGIEMRSFHEGRVTVEDATVVLHKLAQRDLRARVVGEYRGDHARVKQAVNETAAALHDALAQVADAAQQVSAASEQIDRSTRPPAASTVSFPTI